MLHSYDEKTQFKEDEADMRSNDRLILDLLKGLEISYFSFDGLKRISHMHQETLSRALKRLEEAGYVKKVENLYSLTIPRAGSKDGGSIPISSILLPDNVKLDAVLQGLKGKWFGDFRWLGYKAQGDNLVMYWVSSEGDTLMEASVKNSKLDIFVSFTSGRKMGSVLKDTYSLIGIISCYLRKDGNNSSFLNRRTA